MCHNMASRCEPWKRMMLVQSIPEGWSQDMLENFVEVVTKAELEEGGVEHFCGVRHTALMTFTQPLNEEVVHAAQARSRQRSKPLVYSLLPAPSAAVLVRNAGPAVTRDHLCLYFETARSGGREGAVRSCHMYPSVGAAVVSFYTAKVAAAVLAVREHCPSKGSSITVTPCYQQFHQTILDDLKLKESTRVADHTPTDGQASSSQIPSPSAFTKEKSPVSVKPLSPLEPVKPVILPKPVKPVLLPKPVGSPNQPKPVGSQNPPKPIGSPNPPKPVGSPNPPKPVGSPNPPKPVVPFHGASEKCGDIRSGPQNWNTQSIPNPGQTAASESDPPTNAFQHERRGGGRRKRRNRQRGSRKGQCDSNQEENPSREKSWGSRGRPGERGRPPFGCYEKRGRGGYVQRGGYASRPQDVRLCDSGPGHVSCATRSAAPQPIVLDADCNPLPQGASLASNSSGTDVSLPPTEDGYGMEEGDDYGMEEGDDDGSDGLRVSLEDVSLQWSPSAQQSALELEKECAAVPANLTFLEPRCAETPLKTSPGGSKASVRPTTTDVRVDAARAHEQNLMQLQLEKEREAERLKEKREAERLREKEREAERLREKEREAVRLREIEREAVRLREKEREAVRLREKEREAEQLREIEREAVRLREIEREAVRLREIEREAVRLREKEREAEQLREKEREAERLREKEREAEQLREKEREAERLREKEREAERMKQKQLELERELQRKDMELERMKQEKEVLEKRRKEVMCFPSYKLRLMRDFAQNSTVMLMCEISIHEKEGTVEFYGSGDNFDNAKCAFMLTLQDTEEGSLAISSTMSGILRSEQGQVYLAQVEQSYSCSFEVQDLRVVCAAFYVNSVQGALDELRRNVLSEKIKVMKSILPQLQMLKHQLEEDFPLARMTLPTAAGSCEVVVEGVDGDFDLLKRQLQEHCSMNQPDTGVFRIQGVLEIRACRQWCAQEMDDVKTLILKSNGECQPQDGPGQLGFLYQCHKDVMSQVQAKLDNIHKMTTVSKVNLHTDLKRYSERALVINGMRSMGIEPFCRLLEGTLKKEGGWDAIVHFNLPAKCKLPKFEYTQTKRGGDRQPRPRLRPALRPSVQQDSQQQRRQLHHQRRHGGTAIRPFTATVGSSSLTVKSGDIAQENVDGLVCVVGADNDLNQTAVGQAIVKKYPRCAQLFPPGQNYPAGRVVSVALQPSGQALLRGMLPQEPTSLHTVVLAKFPQQQIAAQIQTLVQKCLQSAVQQGNRSIAFPPLGMGRKFQFPLDTVVKAMVTTVHQFLQSNPRSLQSVTIVIYGVGEARQFREAAKKIIQPPPPAFLNFPQAIIDSPPSDDTDDDDDDDDGAGAGDFFRRAADDDYGDDGNGDDDVRWDFFSAPADASGGRGDFFSQAAGRASAASDDDDDDDGDNELSFFHLDDDDDQRGFGLSPPPTATNATTTTTTAAAPSSPGSFEALVCLRSQQDFPAIRQGLLHQLRSTFIHEDRLTDLRTFKKLGSQAMDSIRTAALQKGVFLALQSLGGREVLVVRGPKGEVSEVMSLIKDKQHQFLQKEGATRHQAGSLPSASRSIRLPTYWKVCQDGLFKDFEQFFRDHRKYGMLYTTDDAGVKEIKDLIQKTWNQHLVGAGNDAKNLGHRGVKVEKVERLENPTLWEKYCMHRERLIRRAKQQPFLPLDKVKGSSGALKTSANIHRHGQLSREMFPLVNEHYLFHGTKKEYIQAIHDQGLDERIASENSMLGRGVYAAESATKADQYTDNKANRTSGSKTMILMRVLLGEPFVNKAQNPTKYSRPPCKRCYKDRCQCKGGDFFDSVMDDAGRNFREFVVYDRSMCYPEYFITYQRL